MLSFGSVEQILACTCVKTSTCERYGSFDEIFIGKAIGIINEKEKAKLNGNDDSYEKESTVFEISKTIQGKEKKEIKVLNSTDFGCGTSFEKGQIYLVFANGDEQRGFGTSMCAGNLLLSEADKDLKELDKLKETKGGTFIGRVVKRLQYTDKDFEPMSNVKIQIQDIENETKIIETVTDKKGDYYILVPKGKYKITPVIPTHTNFERFSLSGKDILEIEKGCVVQRFAVQSDSKVSGKVLDNDGNFLEDIKVELVPIGEESQLFDGVNGYSDKNGNFEITKIPSGTYTLSVNFTRKPNLEYPFHTSFYPNAKKRFDAQIIRIELGQSLENIVFQLQPQIPKIKLKGKLVFPDKKPAGNFTVNLQRGDSDNSFSYTKTDKNGNFEIEGFLGKDYNFGIDYYGDVAENENWTIDKSVFKLNEKTQPFRLVLKKKEVEK